MKLLLLSLLICIYGAYSKILPDFIPQCKRSDPDIEKCVLSAIEKVKPHLNKGIPEIKVPGYEPLEIPHLSIDRNLEALRIKAKLDKVIIRGASAYKIKSLKLDVNKLIADVSIVLPRLHVTCQYEVNGRLLLIPLAGKGIFDGNFTDTTARLKVVGKTIVKKGVSHLQVDKVNSKIRIGNGRVQFLDSGTNLLIAETTANFFNSNPRLVLDIINPIIEESSDALVKKYANRILKGIPASEIIVD